MIIRTNKVFFIISKYLTSFIFLIFPITFFIASIIGAYQTKNIFFLLLLIPFYILSILVKKFFKMHVELQYDTETEKMFIEDKALSKCDIVTITFLPSFYIIIKYKYYDNVKKAISTVSYSDYKKININ